MEVWKDIGGYEGLYLVSSKGRVKSLERYRERTDRVRMKIKDKVLKLRFSDDGYLKVDLTRGGKRKTFLVHRLVAVAFIPNPENKPKVNHIDGKKNNNEASNLEWSTTSENIKHAYATGLINTSKFKGEGNVNSKLSEMQIKYIRDNYIPRDKDFGMKALGLKFGVSQNAISKIINRKTWKEVI